MVLYDMFNLKKYGPVVLSVVVMSGVLSGCANSVELSENEQNLVAEYAAQVVLKHDKNYISRLEKVTTAKTESETTKSTDKTDSTSESETVVSKENETIKENNFSDAIGFESLDVKYTGFVLCDSYPQTGDLTFKLNSENNTKLLVLKFNVANNTSSPVTVKMMSADTLITLNVNGTDSYKALLTLLLDGLNTFNGTLQAGEDKEQVLVFQIPSMNEQDISELTLDISSGSSFDSFDLK